MGQHGLLYVSCTASEPEAVDRFMWSLMFSFGIEFSQLYQAEWINSIRATILGGLILGKGFLWIDLVRYTVGITLSYGLDQYFRPKLHRIDK